MHRPRAVLFLLAVGLVAALAPAAAAAASDSPTLGLRYPSLTPDGKTVVFAYRGDLWSAAASGKGQALRLTLHEAQDTLCRVSPDGKTIAFSSLRNGNYDLFVVPVTGGYPKQITFHSAAEILCDWSPDGRRLLFASQRAAGRDGLDLYEVDVDGGTPRRITHDGGREGSYSPDGRSVVYVRGFVDQYWDNYEGSANFDLYTVPVEGGIPHRVTKTPTNERWPSWSADGKRIWFVAEENGVANFYSTHAEGGERAQVTKYTGEDVHRPCLSPDHETVVFERGGKLFVTNLAKPGEKPDAIPLHIESDVRNSGVERRTLSGGGEQVDVSRDGSSCAFTLRGDIWIMPASGGEGRRVTSGPANDQWPRFSPDGRKLAYFSNARGNNDIYVLDLASGKTTQATRHPADDFYHDWSADGRHLVFTSERSGNRDLWLLDLETEEATQLTHDQAADDDARFSRDGRFIAFDSGRDGGQAIYVMNADGSNVRRVTEGSGFFQVPCFSPDGRMIVYESFNPTGGSGGLFVTYTAGGPSARISQDGSGACWTAAGDFIYFAAERRGEGNGVFRLRAPERVETGELVPFYGHVEVDIRQELGNLFDEAWSALRDGFYDPRMHGVNWNELRRKYRDMAIDTENKAEFQNVIRQMIAELGASHLGIGGGETPGNSVTPDVVQNGVFGLDFETRPGEGGERRIEHVVPGGPADQAGLRAGDVVTRIGKTKLDATTNMDRLTAGTVGQEVQIGFRPITENGLGDERSVTVKPVSLLQLFLLRQKNWLDSNESRVAAATKGRDYKLGYIHLSMMDGENLQKFSRTVAQWNADRNVGAMVLDVRDNGGGNIHGQLIQILTAKPLALVQRRGGPRTPQPSLYWDRPVVLLINQRSFSDAEVFPYMFKEAKLGKIVGVPTAGGVIGTQDITLSDGSTFRIPTVGFWGMDGTPLEGLGVKPDYYVEITAEDRAANRDPQLAKAIELAMAEADAARKKPEPAKPEAKPAPVKPVEPKPEKEPETKADDRHPLRDAVAGEWVKYRTTDAIGAPATVLVEVKKVADGTVTFGHEVQEGDDPSLPFPETAKADADLLDLLPRLGKVLSHQVVKGEVKGETADLLQVDMQWPDGSELRLTFTNRVPAYGLLRVQMGKTTLLEAWEWGTPEAGPAVEAPKAPRHPVHDAKVGEWVKTKMILDDGRELVRTLTVKEVRDGELILAQTLEAAGRTMQGQDIPRPRDEFIVPPQNFTLVGYGREKVTVNGQELDCVTMTAKDPNGVVFEWWISDQIPVNGYVKVTRDGKTFVELVDWSR